MIFFSHKTTFQFTFHSTQSLASALAKKDINAFRRVLHSPSDVEKYDSETKMSIFEQACQTENCGEFIEECVSIGCDVNKVSNFRLQMNLR